eukprot:GDKH01001914.1.p3 GENE.GDKH01001914.1~~GDKH01001914.1.p3  ORF type:complete len:51 (+),score=2.79 GDKH01001914.1:118-270(+)
MAVGKHLALGVHLPTTLNQTSDHRLRGVRRRAALAILECRIIVPQVGPTP